MINEITHSHLEIEVRLARARAVVDAATVTPEAGATAAMDLVRRHLESLRSEVESHALYEEMKLFPALARILGSSPPEVTRLIAEHGELSGMLDALDEAVADGDAHLVSARLHSFAAAFDRHSEDEANILDTTANLMDPGGPAA